MERIVEMDIKHFSTSGKIRVEKEEMGNDEIRFRLKYWDDSGVSITTNANQAYWQNAHYHKFGNELYAIQKGKIIVAIQEGNKIKYKILKNSDSIVLNQGIKHNIFLFPNTVIYNVKFGNVVPNDWNEAKWLDEQCKKANIKNILYNNIEKVI